MPAKNANGRRTERRIVPTFESPDFGAVLGIPTVWEESAEDVEERSEAPRDVDTKAVGLLDVGVWLKDCLVVRDEAVVGRDVVEDDGDVEEPLELLVLAALLLLGLLDPPYVHPAPNGIDGP